jgi:hypothetical protein
LQPLLDVAPAQGDDLPLRYQEWAGYEYLAEGLRVLGYRTQAGEEVNAAADRIILPPRFPFALE